MTRIQWLYLLIAMITMPCLTVHGQKKVYPEVPKALLVQIRSESNRIKYFEQKKQYKKAEEVRRDAEKIMKIMINDFNDHYSFTPVYYFVDTNLTKIKNKDFDGVLLDNELHPVANPPISKSDSNYYIVYYGTPSHTDDDNKMAPRQRLGKGFVVMNHNYKQMERPFPYYVYKLGYYELFVPETKYSYVSKKYDMEYFEMAHILHRDFENFFAVRYHLK